MSKRKGLVKRAIYILPFYSSLNMSMGEYFILTGVPEI
jgi:hypothetical protein